MLTRRMRSHYLKKNISVNKITRLLYPLNTRVDNILLGFSYWRLYQNYTGYCVRVRRSSDNAEADFGFVKGYIDSSAIVDFVGAGNSGYVTTWYNQYVGGNNAVQATAGNQPIIVSSGIFESNGLKFVTVDSRSLILNNYTAVNFTTPPVSIYMNWVSLDNTGVRVIFYKNTGSFTQFGVMLVTTINFRINVIGTANIFTHTALPVGTVIKNLYTWIDQNMNGITGNQNNVVLLGTQNTDITTGDTITIGIRNYSSASPLQGHIKSIVMADTVIDYSIISKV